MEESDWLMEKIFMVVERFQFHKEKAGEDNPMISEFAKKCAKLRCMKCGC